MITLFVGDNTEYTADRAKQHDPGAFLIDFSNWRKILKDRPSERSFTAYTSLSDLPKIDREISPLWELLEISDEIYYVPPEIWSDHTEKFSWTGQKTLTEFYLYLQGQSGKSIIGLDVTPYKNSSYLELVSARTHDAASLWISGCSFSHGEGINPNQRYGHLVGLAMGMPTYHLTRSGSSLEWQADQILRSDIRKQDIVIWGLTHEPRAPIAHDGRIDAWPDDTIENIEYRLHETRFYKAITSVFQVINFCEKIGCRLILLPLLASERLQMSLIGQPAFYPIPYQVKYLDLGSDGWHPGSRQHQFWADFCLRILDENHGVK